MRRRRPNADVSSVSSESVSYGDSGTTSPADSQSSTSVATSSTSAANALASSSRRRGGGGQTAPQRRQRPGLPSFERPPPPTSTAASSPRGRGGGGTSRPQPSRSRTADVSLDAPLDGDGGEWGDTLRNIRTMIREARETRERTDRLTSGGGGRNRRTRHTGHDADPSDDSPHNGDSSDFEEVPEGDTDEEEEEDEDEEDDAEEGGARPAARRGTNNRDTIDELDGEDEDAVLFDLAESMGDAQPRNTLGPLLTNVRTIIRLETIRAHARRLGHAAGGPANPVEGGGAPSTGAANEAPISGAPTPAAAGAAGDDAGMRPISAADAPSRAAVQDLLALRTEELRGVWRETARLLHREALRAADDYSRTLDFQVRGYFERVARILMEKDELFEIIDGHLLAGDAETDEIVQCAAFVAYMVGEGSREPVFGATADDLFPVILTDRSRLKRIVALTSLFSLLEREGEQDRLVYDVFRTDVPRALLVRMRQYLPELLGGLTAVHAEDGSPSVGPGATSAASPLGETTSALLGVASPVTSALLGPAGDAGGLSLPDLALPAAAASSPAAAAPTATTASASASSNAALGYVVYRPQVGDAVARGPDWSGHMQDHACFRGVIVAVLDGRDATGSGSTSSDEDDDDNTTDDQPRLPRGVFTVVVRWDPTTTAADSATRTRVNTNLRSRLFRYTCGAYGHQQIIPLAEHRARQEFDFATHNLRMDEFMLMSAVAGVLSFKQQAVPLMLQCRTMESMLAILRLHGRHDGLLRAVVVARLRCCHLGPEGEEKALDFEWDASHLQPAPVHQAVVALRSWREMMARALWVLNGSLRNKAMLPSFMQRDGLGLVLALLRTTSILSLRYGCALVLGQLVKPEILPEALPYLTPDTLRAMLVAVAELFQSDSNDIRGCAAAFYFNAFSYAPLLREFDALAGVTHTPRSSTNDLRLHHPHMVSPRRPANNNHHHPNSSSSGGQSPSGRVRPAATAGSSLPPHPPLQQGGIGAIIAALAAIIDTDGDSGRDLFSAVTEHSHLVTMLLRSLFVYLGSHLLLIGQFHLRRHRTLTSVHGGTSDGHFLPRDEATIDAVIAALYELEPVEEAERADGAQGGPHADAPAPPRDYVAHSRVSDDQWRPFEHLVTTLNLHEVLLEIVHGFETHRKREVRLAALSVLYLLSVAPCARTPIAESLFKPVDAVDEFRVTAPQLRGMRVLLAVIEDSDVSAKEAVAANSRALLVIAMLLMPPAAAFAPGGSAVSPLSLAAMPPGPAAVHTAAYVAACGLFRACDGVRLLLSLKTTTTVEGGALPASAITPLLLHMAAAQVLVLSSLRHYDDTRQLFEALGVRRLAVELQQQFRPLRDQMASDGREEPRAIKLFMRNCLALASGFFPSAHNEQTHNGAGNGAVGGGGAGSGGSGVGPSMGDAGAPSGYDRDLQERQMIIESASVQYRRDSLLELMARHLDGEGLHTAATALRRDADLPLPATPTTATNETNTTATGAVSFQQAHEAQPRGGPTLDHIVRSYLRQQHQSTMRPIATLPQVDLTRTKPFAVLEMPPVASLPRAVPPPPTNAMNRLLNRRLGIDAWSRAQDRHDRALRRLCCPLYEIRSGSGDDFDVSVVDFCDGGESLVVGTTEGAIAVFSHTDRGALLETHYLFEENEIMYIDVSNDSELFMVVNASGEGRLVRRSAMSTPLLSKEMVATAHFNPMGATEMALTMENEEVRIVDTTCGATIEVFKGIEGSSSNLLNAACYDPTGTLVLTNGLLFDVRSPGRPVHRFDRLSEHYSSIFLPSGAGVIVDANVWDLRTMAAVTPCPALLHSLPQCGQRGSYIYAPIMNEDVSRPTGVVNVVHAHTFEVVSTYNFGAHLETFAIDVFSEAYFATICELDNADKMLQVCQMGKQSKDLAAPGMGADMGPVDSDDDFDDGDFDDDELDEDDEEDDAGVFDDDGASEEGSEDDDDDDDDDAYFPSTSHDSEGGRGSA